MASEVDTEFPYRVRIVDRGVDCRDLENGLTSLNKEVRPFFLSDNSIWSFPSVSSLSDYSIWSSWRLFYPCDHSIWSI